MFLKSGKYWEFQFSYIFPKTNLLEHFKRNNISTLVIDQCVGGTLETRAKEREKTWASDYLPRLAERGTGAKLNKSLITNRSLWLIQFSD